jgi:hypothetical protein
MATVETRPAQFVRCLPTLSRAAALIDVSPAGITRGVEELGIEPIPWGRREKHLSVEDLLRLAIHLQRAPLEGVAGGLLEEVERDYPEQVEAVSGDVDLFFESLPARRPSSREDFLGELYDSLPPKYAKQAAAIYLRYADNSK